MVRGCFIWECWSWTNERIEGDNKCVCVCCASHSSLLLASVVSSLFWSFHQQSDLQTPSSLKWTACLPVSTTCTIRPRWNLRKKSLTRRLTRVGDKTLETLLKVWSNFFSLSSLCQTPCYNKRYLMNGSGLIETALEQLIGLCRSLVYLWTCSFGINFFLTYFYVILIRSLLRSSSPSRCSEICLHICVLSQLAPQLAPQQISELGWTWLD